MELTTRFSASSFLEIKVDTIEETIFNHSTEEIDNLIHNLTNVIADLEHLKSTNK
jgi:hypothetical protein